MKSLLHTLLAAAMSVPAAANILLPPICPCEMSDWAVQSLTPTTVGALRKVVVRIANVGAGLALGVPATIDVWSQGDPFDPADDFIQSTERCGLIYVVRRNGVVFSSGSLAIPPIEAGSWTDIPISFPATPDTWTVKVEVRPRIQLVNKYQSTLPLPECYAGPSSGDCVRLNQYKNNNTGIWMSPMIIINP